MPAAEQCAWERRSEGSGQIALKNFGKDARRMFDGLCGIETVTAQ